MEDRKEKNVEWLSVPPFGDWEDQNGNALDYSLNFSKLRESRKENKKDISRVGVGNQEELKSNHKKEDQHHHHRYHRRSTDRVELNPKHSHSTTTRRSILSYFSCFIKA